MQRGPHMHNYRISKRSNQILNRIKRKDWPIPCLKLLGFSASVSNINKDIEFSLLLTLKIVGLGQQFDRSMKETLHCPSNQMWSPFLFFSTSFLWQKYQMWSSWCSLGNITNLMLHFSKLLATHRFTYHYRRKCHSSMIMLPGLLYKMLIHIHLLTHCLIDDNWNKLNGLQ